MVINQNINFLTMAEMRLMDEEYIQALIDAEISCVTLLGYYTKGDTPNPINYYISNTTEADDNGSVIAIGSIKLKHDFGGTINPLYYGAQTGLTQSMVNRLVTTYEISSALNLNNTEISLLTGSSFVFNGGSLNNGTIKNGFIKVTSSGIIANQGFKLTDNYVYLNNDVTINADYQLAGTFTIESNERATITVTRLAFYNANVTLLNCKFIKQSGAFKFLNRDAYNFCLNVRIENCSIDHINITDFSSDDFWSIVIGTNPANRASEEEQPYVKFYCVNTDFSNTGIAVAEADVNIDKCNFVAGTNNSDNHELLHLAGGSRRRRSIVRDSVFDLNGILVDAIDVYNSSNKVIDSCRFKGANGTNYITVKSHINAATVGPNTGIDSDQIGNQGNIIIKNSLFEGKCSRNFGAISIYNSDRLNNTGEFPEIYKRECVIVNDNYFRLDDDETDTGNNFNVAITLGQTNDVHIARNTLILNPCQRGVMVNLITANPSKRIWISENEIKNKNAASSGSSKLIGRSGSVGTLEDSWIINNYVEKGYCFNETTVFKNLYILSNKSTSVINGSRANFLNCVIKDNNNNNLFNDDYGITANRNPSPTIGRSFFDTTLGKPIWWNGTVWKDAAGATV